MRDACTILLTYRPPPDITARGYEPWLREHDNPFFNAIPGIRRYENWKIEQAVGAPGFTHFDFLELDETDLERVWFNAGLTRFRKGWVKRWGYGGDGEAPSALNSYGYVMRAVRQPRLRHSRIVLSGWRTQAPRDVMDTWTMQSILRKHYAIGPAPVGTPWRQPAASARWLDFQSIGVETSGNRISDGLEDEAVFVATASLLAAPCVNGLGSMGD